MAVWSQVKVWGRRLSLLPIICTPALSVTQQRCCSCSCRYISVMSLHFPLSLYSLLYNRCRYEAGGPVVYNREQFVVVGGVVVRRFRSRDVRQRHRQLDIVRRLNFLFRVAVHRHNDLGGKEVAFQRRTGQYTSPPTPNMPLRPTIAVFVSVGGRIQCCAIRAMPPPSPSVSSVTALVTSTKLSYVEPGQYWDWWPSLAGLPSFHSAWPSLLGEVHRVLYWRWFRPPLGKNGEFFVVM